MGSQLSSIWSLTCRPVHEEFAELDGCLPDYHRVVLSLPGDNDKLFTFSPSHQSGRDGGHRHHHARWLLNSLGWTHLIWTVMAPLLPPLFATLNLNKSTKKFPQSFQFIIDFIFVQKGNKILWFCLGRECILCSINYKEISDCHAVTCYLSRPLFCSYCLFKNMEMY